LTNLHTGVMVGPMRKYTKNQIVEILRSEVAKSSAAQVSETLGVPPSLVSMVLSGQREISDELSIRFLNQMCGHNRWTFIKLPDVFTRIPNKRVLRDSSKVI